MEANINDSEHETDESHDSQEELIGYTSNFNGFKNGKRPGGKEWQVCYLNTSVCGLSCLTSVQTWVSKLLETTQLQLDTVTVAGTATAAAVLSD